jgi:hypothetical protein
MPREPLRSQWQNLDESFAAFVKETEPPLRHALVGLGQDRGLEATAETLAYAFENWERIESMENPAVHPRLLRRPRTVRQSRESQHRRK